MKRAFFDIILFLSIFLFPWWVALVLAIIGLFMFQSFYEFLLVSIVLYLLYSIPKLSFINSSILVYLAIIIFYLFAQYLRRRMIIYKNEIS